MKVLHLPALVAATIFGVSVCANAAEPDWEKFNEETLKHFQAVVQMNTSDPPSGDFVPPGGEKPVADYLVDALKAEGIDVQTFANEENRPNVVARLKGNGNKKPFLLMAHSDTVSIDEAKWSHPPFGAVREDGWIYGRGTVDDKDNLAASLMVMLTLKRLNIPLERDLIFLVEAGEEGAMHVGIEFMIKNHFDEIDAEFCYAEGGGVTLRDGQIEGIGIQTMEKVPRPIELIARGVAGHGSVPLKTNSVARLSKAIAAVAEWQAPIRLNETTMAYFENLAATSPPERAKHYRAIMNQGTEEADEAFEYFLTEEPALASLLHTSVSPNIFEGGYRFNVIPSESKAILDVRVIPGDDPDFILESLREVIDDTAVTADWYPFPIRSGGMARLHTDAYNALAASFEKHYDGAPVVPRMSTGATDMAYLRGEGIQCYGMGPAIDVADGAKGYGAHSDQERIIESELYRFTRAYYDAVVAVVGAE
jgi:acetylornithine deacetylase/succinyl-diaminopimelate desuccinylase-like protein